MKSSSKFTTLIAAGLAATLLSSAAFVAQAETVMMGNEGAIQIEAALKAKMAEYGLDYPSAENLTFSQVQELLLVLNKPDDTPGDETAAEKNAKIADAKQVLSRINSAEPITAANQGVPQILDDLRNKLQSVGLDYPTAETLTIAQVSALYAVFDEPYKDGTLPTQAEKTARANDAQVILNLAAFPANESNTTPEVLALRAELDSKMIAIGLTLPADKSLSLGQIVQLLAVFSANDSAEVKAASDQDAARVKDQNASITALLGTM